MSKTGAIYINLKGIDKSKYLGIIETLIANHWSANKDGGICFMLNGTFDWQSAPFSDLNKVISQVKHSFENVNETAIDLVWKDRTTIIGLLFTNDENLIITISENIKKTKDGLNVDFPFYVEKLSSILQDLKADDIKYGYD
jgi:hypothetical protein